MIKKLKIGTKDDFFTKARILFTSGRKAGYKMRESCRKRKILIIF